MKINCPKCSKSMELPFVPAEGQHIRCPFCNEKFSFSIKMSLSRFVNKASDDETASSPASEVDENQIEGGDPSKTRKMPRNLASCPDCGHLVSKRATTCPNCGAPVGDGSICAGDNIKSEENPFHWMNYIGQIINRWFDAYKRIFDFNGYTNRSYLLSFLGVYFIIDIVLNFLIRKSVITSACIVLPVMIVGTYAMFSMGLRRLNDIGVSRLWSLFLGLVFIIGLVYDSITFTGIGSPLFSSVLRIDNYLLVLLLCISWVRSKDVQHKKKSLKWILPVVGIVVYSLFVCLAYNAFVKNLEEVKLEVSNCKSYQRIKDRSYQNISYNVYSRDGTSSTYIINTDGPANAQIMAVYVMGRLHTAQLIQSGDESAA